MNHPFDTIIVGGGAAGIFAAINCAAKYPEQRVAVLEKSANLLSKVKVSGGGRCNVTHGCFDPRELVKFYPRGEKELIGPFHQFQPGDTIAWFAERDVELKVEDDGRMFPVTDNSQTIIDCFLKEIEQHGVALHLQTKVETVTKSGEQFEVSTSNGAFTCRNLVITSGGANKAEAYAFIRNLGHTIVDPAPSLFTFNLPGNSILQLQGLVAQAEVRLNDYKLSEQGPLLITHWGMSGPAILKLSAWGARQLQENQYHFTFTVNWLPGETETTAFELLNGIKSAEAAKKISNALPIDVPKKLKAFLMEKAGIDPEIKWAEVSKQHLQEFARLLTHDQFQSQGKTTFKQEFVTCGGVTLSEVNFKTMESKLVPGLFFAGEVLDIDSLTGGFNFQAAWTTAWIASENCY
ncbi:MAG: NAD(P)/FAD-dependent oxidoreductase [Flavobacteriales bacterium]|nr:NAD(P)/FAD-dependent oxidoreductase [Flavobacteriales bacterium]